MSYKGTLKVCRANTSEATTENRSPPTNFPFLELSSQCRLAVLSRADSAKKSRARDANINTLHNRLSEAWHSEQTSPERELALVL